MGAGADAGDGILGALTGVSAGLAGADTGAGAAAGTGAGACCLARRALAAARS